ncbi:MAG: LptF/LptG family permease [Gemmatimonadota bacterium]
MLTRYLIRVHVGPFIFSLTAITGLIFLNAVAQRIEALVGKGLPWSVIVEFLVLSLPHTVALSLPMSVLVAVLYAFSELTASNEITAMAGGGVRPLRIVLPILGMGAVATAAMLYFNDAVLPEANHRLKNLLIDIGRKSPTFQLREQVVNEIEAEEGKSTYFLTAARIDPVRNTLEDVAIFDGNNPARRRVTYASRGSMAFNPEKTDLYLTLLDGETHEIQSDHYGGFQRVFFRKQVVPLRGVGDELERRMGGTNRGDREMSFAMLRENAEERRQELAELFRQNRERAMAAVRLALNQPTDADTATLNSFTLQRARGQVAAAVNNESLLARDPLTQSIVIGTRTRASRAHAIEEQINRYMVELQKKWAIAFACLIFTLLAPPLALRFPRGGVGLVVAASTGIFAVYWMGLIGGESLADRRLGDPMITMWIPNLVFLAVGLFLLSRMGRAGSTVRGGGWDSLAWRLRDRLDRVRRRVRVEDAA